MNARLHDFFGGLITGTLIGLGIGFCLGAALTASAAWTDEPPGHWLDQQNYNETDTQSYTIPESHLRIHPVQPRNPMDPCAR